MWIYMLLGLYLACKQLYEETEDGDIAEKTVIYNQANKQVKPVCGQEPFLDFW